MDDQEDQPELSTYCSPEEWKLAWDDVGPSHTSRVNQQLQDLSLDIPSAYQQQSYAIPDPSPRLSTELLTTQYSHRFGHQSAAPKEPFQAVFFSPQEASTSDSSSAFSPLSGSQVPTGGDPSPSAYHAPPHAQNTPRYLSYRSMSLPEHGMTAADARPPPSNFLPAPKQIRFVSTDGQPHTKRRRINAACLTCRKRKTRCSGERPVCKTCIDNGHSCTGYAEAPSRKNTAGRSIDGDDDDEANDSGDSVTRSHKRPNSFPAPTSDATLRAMPPLRKHPSVDSNASNVVKDALDFVSPESNHTANSSSISNRHRVPFFRYFGPTAIAPGFKQMVVQLKDRDHRRSGVSLSGESPASGGLADPVSGGESSPQEVVFYDAADSGPVAPLITHLVETFFTNLGCSYPFLQRERFMKDLEEKRVDAILVDAVCAIAARFSSNPSLARPYDETTPVDEKGEVKTAFRGQQYAHRAASALVETFGSPTTSAAQASLLLAYEEFGTDRDSGLWMFLGVACRMAVDIGLHRLEGMQLSGRLGPTPKTAKAPQEDGKREEEKRAAQQEKLTRALLEQEQEDALEDRRASEEGRIDSFWTIFFLDRAVSSGVGRPVTLRDKDIELSFPYSPDETIVNGYPHPFPVMIRIMHLYGRVSNVINNIEGPTGVDAEGVKKLTSMEKDLTGIYQKMSPRLHFNPTNFQHYVKAEQGTNFILLHFWFHTSIILLHQPTLMYSLDTNIQQLFPDSRELSMSSAKTIADILAFAELIDVRSFIGNPFTSQPMYIAACAFLAEARAHSSRPPTRQTTPLNHHKSEVGSLKSSLPGMSSGDSRAPTTSRVGGRHSLLATTATQNYQVCYKALNILNKYWAGCRYIITALDQKSQGLLDITLYTSDDIDGEMPSVEPSFTQPGWRRSHSMNAADRRTSIPWSPRMDWSQAIGWSLTGTTNSPQPNLSFLYPNPPDRDRQGSIGLHARRQQLSRLRSSSTLNPTQESSNVDATSMASNERPSRSMMPPPTSRSSQLPHDPVSAADADLLLGLHSPYSVGSSGVSQTGQQSSLTFDYVTAPTALQHQTSSGQNVYFAPPGNGVNTPGFTDMLIESQDVDVSNQAFQPHFDNLNLPGGADMFWLEYLPQDVLSYFHQTPDSGGTGNPPGMIMPSGPRPSSAGNSSNWRRGDDQ